MNKISCHIIRDLLPSYIDDVLSEDSKTDVKNHLEECNECKNVFDEMNTAINVNTTVEEANLIRKVRNKMNKKTRNIIITSAAICLALIIFVGVGTTQAIASINAGDVEVEVTTEKLSDSKPITPEGKSEIGDDVTLVTTFNDEHPEGLSEVTLNNDEGNTFVFVVGDEVKENNEYVSVVTWKTKKDFKLLSVLCTDRRNEEGNIIIDVTDYKTDLYSYMLAGETKNNYPATTAMYFGKVVEINYNGNTIWKAE